MTGLPTTNHTAAGETPTAKALLPDHDCLGFRVNPATIDNYVEAASVAVRHRQPLTVFYHNLHSLYAYFLSADLRRCYDKFKVLVDGMPVIWLLKLCGHDVSRDQRITYVDFIWPLLERARDENWRVYHLGQSNEVQQQALQVIRDRLPGLEIGGHHGYFNLQDDAACREVIDSMNAFGTDLVLVGFGAPKQEIWVDKYRGSIEAGALFTCGACMEYVAGHVRTPPRWMGRAGLEWSYRLFENPRRFAFRYFIEPVILGLILLRNLLISRRSTRP